MRPRSADEWRSFWHHGGEEELLRQLRLVWAPLRAAAEGASARPAERVATLLGSNAPAHALASELGRIRSDELGVGPDAEEDRQAAAAIVAWFTATSSRG
jgi:hypothetical protein